MKRLSNRSWVGLALCAAAAVTLGAEEAEAKRFRIGSSRSAPAASAAPTASAPAMKPPAAAQAAKPAARTGGGVVFISTGTAATAGERPGSAATPAVPRVPVVRPAVAVAAPTAPAAPAEPERRTFTVINASGSGGFQSLNGTSAAQP